MKFVKYALHSENGVIYCNCNNQIAIITGENYGKQTSEIFSCSSAGGKHHESRRDSTCITARAFKADDAAGKRARSDSFHSRQALAYADGGGKISARQSEGNRCVLDAGLIIEPAIDLAKYDFLRFHEKERWGVLVSAENPLFRKESVSKSDLVGERLFVPFRIRNQLEEIFGISIHSPNVFGTHNLLGNVATLVRENAGAAITIDGATELYDKRTLGWRPFEPEIILSSVLIWKKYKAASPSAAKFIEFVEHSIRL